MENINEDSSNNEVLWFIENFMGYCKTKEEFELIRKTFRAGYCLYFAEMLQNAFGRGEVCWTAPIGHFVWKDSKDNKVYDVEGLYNGDALYFIPKEYLGDAIKDFRHSDWLGDTGYQSKGASQEEIIGIIKRYCIDTGKEFDVKELTYYGFDVGSKTDELKAF